MRQPFIVAAILAVHHVTVVQAIALEMAIVVAVGDAEAVAIKRVNQ